MKKLLFALALVALLAGTAAAAKKPKKVAGRSELIDYKGQALGREIPAWVNAVVDGNKEAVKKELRLDGDPMLFVLSKQGDNLDFLQVWVDQIDARVEVVNSLETSIASVVETELKGQNKDKETIDRAVKTYSLQATNMTLNGLQKLNSYWTKTRTLKPNVKKGKRADDYDYVVTYYVVFAIDREIYNEQLKSAMENAEDNDDQSETLRNLITTKCSDVLLPIAVGSYDF